MTNEPSPDWLSELLALHGLRDSSLTPDQWATVAACLKGVAQDPYQPLDGRLAAVYRSDLAVRRAIERIDQFLEAEWESREP